MNYAEKLQTSEYDFLRTNPHLGDKILFLALGGSHAYGTNVEGSDLDIRGCALNTKEEILLSNCFEQVIDNSTDTCIYGFNKLIHLLTQCNPNVIELLGLPEDKYFQLSHVGSLMVKGAHVFLSKQCIKTFGGYAYAQLRRLDNKAVRSLDQEANEKHILNSINNARDTFPEKYFSYKDDSISLYLDDAVNKDFDKEIFMDVTLHHYPLRDYKSMWSEMNEIVKIYSKTRSKRNEYAAEHGKLSKHMMHLIRLYLMCIDILLKEEIITYREDDHSLLMSIRNGEFLDENGQPTKEFFSLVEECQQKMEEAAVVSRLPERPDLRRIHEFQAHVNELAVNEQFDLIF